MTSTPTPDSRAEGDDAVWLYRLLRENGIGEERASALADAARNWHGRRITALQKELGEAREAFEELRDARYAEVERKLAAWAERDEWKAKAEAAEQALAQVRAKAALADRLREDIRHASGVDGVFDVAMTFELDYDALSQSVAEGPTR